MKQCLRCGAAFATPDWRCPQCGFAPRLCGGLPHFAPDKDSGDADFPPEAHAALAELERGSFWFRSRNRALALAVRRFFPAARTFFEVGCGTGVVLEHFASVFPALDLTGGELSAPGLAIAKSRLPGARLLQADALDLPFAGEFDLVGMFDVLEHIEDDRRALVQLGKCLRPGGGLLLTVPQHPWLWSDWDVYSCHKRRYGRRELVSKLRDAGFDVLWSSALFSLLLPLLILSRRRSRRSAPADPLDALRLSRPLDAVLDGVCRLERGLLAAGLSLPAGGSLLCVARKMT